MEVATPNMAPNLPMAEVGRPILKLNRATIVGAGPMEAIRHMEAIPNMEVVPIKAGARREADIQNPRANRAAQPKSKSTRSPFAANPAIDRNPSVLPR